MEYTKTARKVLNIALQESAKFGHTYIGTEHILLGLLVERNGLAHSMLIVNGIDELTVRKMIEQNIDSGNEILTVEANGY